LYFHLKIGAVIAAPKKQSTLAGQNRNSFNPLLSLCLWQVRTIF